ncbi:MAG: hypothetical protein U9R49_04630 [Bacteroidota bacterium]|nr:hypothetical protein [Bacteroidota bacterium]
MADLSDKEIEILNREIEKQGLTYTQLQKELLDHLCCDIEAKMDEGLEFLKAFEEVRSRLENNRIQEIQEETLLLINQKYRMMKKFMYILGTIAPSLLIIGAFFKLQHWPGASVLIVLGSFLLGAVYLPVFSMVSIRDTRNKEKQVNKTLYVAGTITGFIFITGVLFKIMHWPGANVALTASVILVVAVFIPVLVSHAIKDKENQMQNFSILIFVLSFMAVNIMVFALKVSKNVLTSMVVTAQANLISSQTMESRTAIFMEHALLSDQTESVQLEKAEFIHAESDALDNYIQDIMAEIVLLTHERNRAAVRMDKSINLKEASYFDNHNSVNLVIFGDEKSAGKGEELQALIESYREFLQTMAEPALYEAIDLLLYTGPLGLGEYQTTWLDFNFNHAPMISALNLLSNLQMNIRFLEGEILKELL